MAIANGTKSADPVYDSADLRSFEETVNAVFADLKRAKDYPLEPGVTDVLRLQLAAAVFECASQGERNPATLKKRVLERFYRLDLDKAG